MRSRVIRVLSIAFFVILLVGPRAYAEDAAVKVTITNGGNDVKGYGTFSVFPAGRREKAVATTSSGGMVTVPPGDYEIRVRYEEGAAKKEIWVPKESVMGSLEKSVEIDLPLARVTFRVTNDGDETGSNGTYTIYSPGDRKKELGYAASGEAATIPSGTYDVQVRYEKDGVRKMAWKNGIRLEGAVDQALEVSVPDAELTVHVRQKKKILKDAWCGVFFAGEKDPLASVTSDHLMKVGEGTYDVGCFYQKGGMEDSKWMRGQALKGKVELSMELDPKLLPPETLPSKPESMPIDPETRPAESQPTEVETMPVVPETRPETLPETIPETRPAEFVVPSLPRPPEFLIPVPGGIPPEAVGCGLIRNPYTDRPGLSRGP